MMARVPRRRAILILVLVGVIVAAYVLWPRAGTRDQHIEGSGTIEATQVDVTPKVAGRVARILVKEGDAVSAGQVVAELDAAELDAQVQQAEAMLLVARARLAQAEESVQLQKPTVDAQLQQSSAQVQAATAALAAHRAAGKAADANVQSAEAALAYAESNFKRLESLFNEGAVSAQQWDAARAVMVAAMAQRDVARAQQEAARAQLRAGQAALEQAHAALQAAEASRRTIVIRQEEAAAARAAVAQSGAGLQLAQITRGQAVLRAPIAGTILSRSVEVGDLLMPGAPVLTIADLSRPFLRVFISDSDLGRVALGQPVEITVDAFPGRVFQGRVSEISSRAEFTPGNVQTKEERVKLVFAVKVSAENQQGVLKPGLPADAVILTTSAGR